MNWLSRWFNDRRNLVILTLFAVFLALLGAMPNINAGGVESYITSWGFVITLGVVAFGAIRVEKRDVLVLLTVFASYMVFMGGADHIPFQTHHVWVYAVVVLGTIFFYENFRPGGLSDQHNDANPATDD